MSSVLLVEDDRPLRESMVAILEREGYAVRVATDGAAGMRELQSSNFDCILLDIGLPFVDGWTLLERMHTSGPPPVIVISARGDESDKVRALDLGADDYLAKPFGAAELLARLRAVLRRARPGSGPGLVAICGDVTVDLGRRSVTRAGHEVSLSPTEYGLLAELVRHRGAVVDHRSLLREVWGSAYGDERNYLRTFVGRLRRKLEANPSEPVVIVTVGARGYRFGPAST
ncbi:MAG: response regulator transcription factor [Candidatus Dormibacteria bacterium]